MIGSPYVICREYQFEVLAMSINWIVMIAAGILLSRVFKKTRRGRSPFKILP